MLHNYEYLRNIAENFKSECFSQLIKNGYWKTDRVHYSYFEFPDGHIEKDMIEANCYMHNNNFYKEIIND